MAASVAMPTLPPPASACSPQKALAGVALEPSAKSLEAPAVESPYLPLEPQDDEQEAESEAPAPTAALEAPAATDAPAKSKSKSKAKATTTKKKAGGGSKKKKKGLENLSGAPCVGLYVDALDLKMLWGEAQIIDCNPEEMKLKVHFIGWKSSYDLWTDRMSVAGHGTYVPLTKKSLAMQRRWDGKSNLFSESEEPQAEGDGDGKAFVPLLKESPQKKQKKAEAAPNEIASASTAAAAVAPPPQAAAALETAAPNAPEASTAPAPTTPPAPEAPPTAAPAALDAPTASASKATPAVRKSRPAKPTAAAAPVAAPKRSPPSKAERGDVATTALTKVSPAVAPNVVATSATASGKKRSKSPAPKASGASAAVTPTPTPAPKRSHKRMKESVELQPANGAAAAVDFAAARSQNVADDALTAGFLQRCAGVWQRQLSAVTSRPS